MTQLPSAPLKFEELASQHPKEAALLQTVVTQAVKDVEHHLGDLPGEKKAQLAQDQAIDMLRKVYAGADMWFGFNPAVDFLVVECLIPLIPKAIDGVVKMFNGTGVFAPSGQTEGVQ